MFASIPEVFPFLKRERHQARASLKGNENAFLQAPSVKLSTNKPSYRPGDTVLATIEVSCDKILPLLSPAEFLLLESFVVEIKGIERLDPQWLLTPELPRGSKGRRGERIILESLPTSIVSDVLFDQDAKRTYLVRVVLPKVLPPSFKGTVVRYIYYFVVSMQWSIAVIENGNNGHLSPKTILPPIEVRTFLNIWTMPTHSGLSFEEPQTKDYWGIVPQTAVQVEIYWKEKNDENDWARASDVLSEIEDDDVSQTTESMLRSPEKGSLTMSFERGIQLQSSALIPRATTKDSLLQRAGVPVFGSLKRPALLTDTSFADSGPEEEIRSNNHRQLAERDSNGSFGSVNYEHKFVPIPRSPSGTYSRGRSYNIRFDDQVLARFSPRNSDSTYYFGDMVGGVLSFFPDEGSRRCLEISAVLETRELLNPAFIHPSRKNSPVITKVQAEFNEAVTDILQTHFVFSIPSDGPPSFTTPQVSLQWILRLEFVTTACNVELNRHEHPLLLAEREKGEWSIPLLVHSPLPKTQKLKARRERPTSPRRDSWGDSPTSGGRIPPLSLPPSRDKFSIKEQLASSSFDST